MNEEDLKIVSRLVIRLTKSNVSNYSHPEDFAKIVTHRNAIHEAVRVLGLTLIVNEDDGNGYAYLKTVVTDDGEELRLVGRRQMKFHESLLLVMLRKRMAEFQHSGSGEVSGAICIVTREEIISDLSAFMPQGPNEVKMFKEIEALINKVIEYGFLSKIKQHTDRFQIEGIITAFINAETLENLLTSYSEHLHRNDAAYAAEAIPEGAVKLTVGDDDFE